MKVSSFLTSVSGLGLAQTGVLQGVPSSGANIGDGYSAQAETPRISTLPLVRHSSARFGELDDRRLE